MQKESLECQRHPAEYKLGLKSEGADGYLVKFGPSFWFPRVTAKYKLCFEHKDTVETFAVDHFGPRMRLRLSNIRLEPRSSSKVGLEPS